MRSASCAVAPSYKLVGARHRHPGHVRVESQEGRSQSLQISKHTATASEDRPSNFAMLCVASFHPRRSRTVTHLCFKRAVGDWRADVMSSERPSAA